ncbi:MAG: hypothetical protein ACYCS1_06745 [Gammaproteobacteria bacterium]
MGSGKSDCDAVTGIELASVFLDGELDEEGCERLLTSAHQSAKLGVRLSCYGLIREVIREHDWRQSVYLASQRVSWTMGIRSRLGTCRRALAGRPVWVWGLLGGLVAGSLAAVLLLGPVRGFGGLGVAPTHDRSVYNRPWVWGRASSQYGQVRSVAWNAPSSAVRQQLEVYWMIHAASLSGSQMMVYPRMAAHNYTVAGRKQGWRHHR